MMPSFFTGHRARFSLLRRFLAASSRSLLLKQVIELPTPLWVEVLSLMGGEYAALAREQYPAA